MSSRKETSGAAGGENKPKIIKEGYVYVSKYLCPEKEQDGWYPMLEKYCVFKKWNMGAKIKIYENSSKTGRPLEVYLHETQTVQKYQLRSGEIRCDLLMNGKVLMILGKRDDIVQPWVTAMETTIKDIAAEKEKHYDGEDDESLRLIRERVMNSSPADQRREQPLRVTLQFYLSVSSYPNPVKDNNQWCPLKDKYGVLQQGNGSAFLQIYEDNSETGEPLTIHLDASNTATKYTVEFSHEECPISGTGEHYPCVLSTEKETLLEWFFCLENIIAGNKERQAQAAHNRSATTPKSGDDPSTVPQRHVIKEGFLEVQLDSAKSDDYKGVQKYCSLEEKDDHYVLNVFDNDSKTGNVVVLDLKTASKVDVYTRMFDEFRCDLTTADGVLVIGETEDCVDRWWAALNTAISSATASPEQYEVFRSDTASGNQRDSLSHDRNTGGTNVPRSASIHQKDSDNNTGGSNVLDHVETPSEIEFLSAYFPELESRCYIVPPEQMNTVHTRDALAKAGYRLQLLTLEKDVKSKLGKKNIAIDLVLKRVHFAMTKIKDRGNAQKEAMVIMTQAKCGEYGAESKSVYEGAAERVNESLDEDPPQLDLDKDFVDLLAIHRTHGVLMGAIVRQSEEELDAQKIRETVAYLQKASDCVETHVFKGIPLTPEIKQTILLPNVTRACLHEVLDSMEDLEELKDCLGGGGPEWTFSQYCLCREEMADDTKLYTWWKNSLQRRKGGDPAMKRPGVYRQLVSRFAVPLTTVQIYLSTQPRIQLWTTGDFVDAVGEEFGRDMTRIALFPGQLGLLEYESTSDGDDELIFLEGPPGTGKTILLVLKGVQWVKEGCRKVFVVNTNPKCRAVPLLVESMLKKSVDQEDFSVECVENHERLCTEAWRVSDKTIYILADEVNCATARELYNQLKRDKQCVVKMWAAGVRLEGAESFPGESNVRLLREPLRSPPTVVREVEKADEIRQAKVRGYVAPPIPPSCDGPTIISLEHYASQYQGDKKGHRAESASLDSPHRCFECGVQVAKVLISTLHVGRQDRTARGQRGLRFNDVFVLASHMDSGGEVPDSHEGSPAPFVRGLRSMGIPTRQVARGDERGLRVVVENSRDKGDAVTLVNEYYVWGLERKIVVYLSYPTRSTKDTADESGRLYAMSRSTSQVIWVKTMLR